jgi:sugar/nucleoside kinase (ribokinase family)
VKLAMSTFDLVCLGGASYDIILRLPRLPMHDEKLVVEYAGRQAGGLVANTACAAARLEVKSAWAGKVGLDEGGELIQQAFRDFGVDTSLVEFDDQAASDFTVILLEPSGERTILVAPVMPIPPPISTQSLAIAVQARLVYTVPHDPAWLLPIFDAVHANGGQAAVDLEGSAPTQGAKLLSDLCACDIVFTNSRGLALAVSETGADLDNEERILTRAIRLVELGVKLVCVTLGRRGAWAFTPQEKVFSPAFSVPVVDTTGAGDCFHAAFLKAYLEGQTLAGALRFANAAAALSIQKVGARAGLPVLAAVEQFLSGQNVSGGRSLG